jgi:signal transduction histidine kinase
LFARATQDVMYDLDLVADTMWCNDRYFELFGETDRPPYEWWVARLHPSDRQRVTESLQQALQGDGDYWAEDYRISRPNGQYAYVMDRGFIMRDSSGRAVRLIGAATDITERKRAEDALRRAERLASIGTLAAGLAHEINNPLGAIVLSAEAATMATQQPDREEILAASLNNIQTAALRCGRIVRSVLHFARDEVSHKWPGDLADVARHVRDVTRRIAAEAGCAVRLEIGDGLPPVVFNPTEMEQVFINLICNAIEASKRGSEVLVRIESWADSVRVVVEDHGRGMGPDELRHLFDPFYTTRQDKGGTGLGLSITYGIIHEHGGTIDVQSEVGRGTTVEIVLPRAASTDKGAE